METQRKRRPFTNSKFPPVKWFKEWVPHDVVTGGKCFVLKWVNEAELNALKEKSKEQELVETEATTEILLLCSYEGCGKTFVDAGALRKHSQIHGEGQHVCHYQNCGKKFRDSSKLNKHYLDHTSERDFVCPYEGCGKAFSVEFNLRSHMKTHSQENHHICLYPKCGKNHAHEYTRKNDITSLHDKNAADGPPRYILVEKTVKASTKFPTVYCPYNGCRKACSNLNLHMRREHPEHLPEKNPIIAQPCNNINYYTENKMAEGSYLKGYAGNTNVQRLNMPNLPPYNVLQQNYAVASPSNLSSMVKQSWLVKNEMHGQEDYGHFPEENIAQPCNYENQMAEGSYLKGYAGNTNVQRLNRPMPNLKLPPYNALQQNYADASSSNLSDIVKPPWPLKDEMHGLEVDYEELKMNGMMWEWDGSWR